MTETRRTVVFVGAATALAFLAWVTTPKVQMPAVFADRGELFFPDFLDPNGATSLEVVEYDERNGAVRPFKVANLRGRWTIPSQHDYPADAKDRLAQAAAAIIALRKDDFASDSSADHERCGVLDPLDLAQSTLKGRGTRLTIRGVDERVLADIIIGKPAEGRDDFRFVRIPDQKRVYLSRVGDLKISTNFGDWIERDLLQVEPAAIDAINILNYSLDEDTGRLDPRETILLEKKGEEWTLAGLEPGERLDQSAVNLLATNLSDLRIVGVLPKPQGITEALRQERQQARVAAEDQTDLATKGFYLADDGRLRSNEGEVTIRTTSGIFYTLRFGEVASGMPGATEAPSVGAVDGEKPPDSAQGRENRYLFIMTAFDPNSARPSRRVAAGVENQAALLRVRFAPWYYIISANSFSSIRAQRKDLVKPTTSGPPVPSRERDRGPAGQRDIREPSRRGAQRIVVE